MEFKLTKETLSRLSEKEDITIRDMMGLIVNDLCKDLSNDGLDMSQLPLGEPDDAIPWTCKLSRMIAKIYKHNKDYFDSEDYKSIWDGAGGKLQQAQQQLELLEQDIQNKTEEIETIQKEIRFRQEGIPNLKDRYDALVQEQADVIKESQQLAQDYEQTKSELEAKKKDYEQRKILIEEQKKVDETLLQAADGTREPYQKLVQKQQLMKRLFGQLMTDLDLTNVSFIDQPMTKKMVEEYRKKLVAADTLIKDYDQLLKYIEKGENGNEMFGLQQ